MPWAYGAVVALQSCIVLCFTVLVPPVVMQVPVTIAVTGMVRLHTAFHAMHEPPWVDWCPVRQLGAQTPYSLLPAPNSLFLSPPIIVQGYPMMDFVVRELRAVVRGPMAMLRCVLVARPALCRCNAPPLRCPLMPSSSVID